MSVTINIQGRVIEFPTSAQSPNWAPALVEFAEAVENALSGIAGAFDIGTQTFTLVSDVNTNLDIPLLTFPTANVRGAFIRYSFHRNSNTVREVETGTLELIYNEGTGAWQFSREAVGTDTKLTFNVTSTGQVQLSTTAIGGTYVVGTLTYQAQALINA